MWQVRADLEKQFVEDEKKFRSMGATMQSMHATLQEQKASRTTGGAGWTCAACFTMSVWHDMSLVYMRHVTVAGCACAMLHNVTVLSCRRTPPPCRGSSGSSSMGDIR